MRQLLQDLRSGRVDVIEVPDPEARSGEVVVATRWSLVSPGTEQAISDTASRSLIGKARARPAAARQVIDKARSEGLRSTVAAVRARLDDALTPGYSSMGVVESIGEGVDGLGAGERVGCFGANYACHAERVAMPAPLCLPLPADLDDRWGAFGALGGVAAHSVRVGDVDAGGTVVVIGLGLVGQLVAQLATVAGARVIGVDRKADRVAKAIELGALAGARLDDGIDAVEATVRAATDGAGADSVIVAAKTADSGPVELAARIARDRATIAVVGDVGMDVPREPFYAKELKLRVSRSYGPGRYDPAYERRGQDYPIGYVRWTQRRLIAYFFEEVAAGRVKLDDLVTHELPVERATEAYEALADPGRLAILLRYEPTDEPRRSRIEIAPVPKRRRVGDRLRLGVIGPGQFARSTLLPKVPTSEVEVAAVASRSPARASSAARRWKGGYATASVDEVLEDDEIDTVLIATRHDSHAELAARALERGKGVFVEKPLAIDEVGLARVEAALATGERLVVGFNRGFAPATGRLRSHLGANPGPLSVSIRVNAGDLHGAWLLDRAEGGGALVGEACHQVDLSSAIVNRPLRWVQVAALEDAGREGDSFVLTLGYEDGSLATVTYVTAGPQRMAKERVEALAAGRSAVIDDFRRVELYGGGPSRPSLSRNRDKGHAELLGAAFRFFREGGEPPIPYRRLIETTRATLLASEALASRRREPVALP